MHLKKLLFISLFLIQLNAISQSRLFKQDFDEFATFGLTEMQLEKHKSEGELFVFNESKHETRLAKTLFDKGVGKKHKEETRTGFKYYEVIAKTDVKHYRINYIFLDGNRMTKDAIERLRQKILGLLDDGIKFTSLARQYSMDRNSYNGGDSGWFKEERTVPIFFKELDNPKLLANEVFSVDLTEANWYYLVQSTFTPTTIKEILVKVTVSE